MHAPQKGYAKLVNLLLQEDSLDINAQDNLGNTALTLTAIHHDNPIIISNLLDHGADPQTVNQEGYNAIMAAKHHKHRGICDLLKERHNNTVYRNASALPVSGMPAPEASAPPLELIEEYERLGFFGAPKVNDMTDTKPEPLKQFNL